ncbi:P-loop NTPase [Cryobacterium sp. MLB-32]|uniref:AAA family ATPase n=1 Tax=Cryobacterium sp. MLB-32 TaxID=1529318 RepID=UPI000689FE9E|nr:P-loop NTPase [Cryobacterium sp. MLB-32]
MSTIELNEAGVAGSPASGSPRVITVFSPRGGVGKSTIAVNTAVGLARVAPLEVVLVDADVQFGDVATFLDLTPAHTLPDMVADAPAADVLVLKTLLTVHPGGYYVVCGAASPVDGDRVTGEQLAHLIDQLTDVFRFVIVDTSPGLGEHALAMIEKATDAVAVCQLSVPSIRALGTALGVLESLGITPALRHVVLNIVDKKSGLSRADAEAILGRSVDIVIPRSSTVALSANRGVPFVDESPRSSAARALHALVTRCAAVPTDGPIPSTAVPGRVNRRKAGQ